MSKTYLIGVCGGSASGKTSVCEVLGFPIISSDAFYIPLTEEQQGHVKDINFDHPRQIDMPLFVKCIRMLKEGKSTRIPIYDHATHSRLGWKVIQPTPILIIEGIFILTDVDLRNEMDLKLFVDVDASTRLIRRIRRDLSKRDRSLESILYQWETFVKPGHDLFVEPSKKYADVIIPTGAHNIKAMNMIKHHIK